MNWAGKNYQFDGPINGPEYTVQWLAFEKLAREMWPEVPTNEQYRAAEILAEAGVWKDDIPSGLPTQSKRDTVTPSLWLKCATVVVCSALLCLGLCMSADSPQVATPETQREFVEKYEQPRIRHREHLKEATADEAERVDAMIMETRGMTFEEKQEYLARLRPAHSSSNHYGPTGKPARPTEDPFAPERRRSTQ